MAQLLEKRSLPTSIGGLKGTGKDMGKYAIGALVILGGLGLAIKALPWIARVPFAGPLVASVLGTGFAYAKPGGPSLVASTDSANAAWGF